MTRKPGPDHKHLDEFATIARYFKPLAGNDPVARGLDDDAAVLTPPPGMDLVFTKDAMVAGVHFFADDPADLVVRKLARVNLSDLASMGARPLGYLVALALPHDWDDDEHAKWLNGLQNGFAADQDEFGWRLWGGDTVSTSGPLTLSLTAVGAVPHGQALARGGAREGDLVFVSGTIGDAAIGLDVRSGKLKPRDPGGARFLLDRFLLPSPRVALGQRLVGVATAAIDVSDGLFADLGHICTVSRLGAEIRRDRIPVSPAACAALEEDGVMTDACWGRLFGGDDYELLFTAPPDARDAILAVADDVGVPVAEIGVMVAGDKAVLINEQGVQVGEPLPGYRHF